MNTTKLPVAVTSRYSRSAISPTTGSPAARYQRAVDARLFPAERPC